MDWLRNRTPSAEKIDTGILESHTLKFHKVSINDHSGKCNAHFTGNQDDLVWGVLYCIPDEEVYLLDAAEDLGVSYRKKQVEIRRVHEGKAAYATTYIAMEATIDEAVQPFCWYHRLVLEGARSHTFPQEYIEQIQQVNAQADPDVERRKVNVKFNCPGDDHQKTESTE